MSRALILSLLLMVAVAEPAHTAEPEPEPALEPSTEPALEPSTEPVPTPAPEPQPTKPEAPVHRSLGAPEDPVLRFVHHGHFRFRPEALINADLGPGASPVPAPLGVSTGVDPDAALLSWASVRLRYQPTLLVGYNLEVHATFDALDNLVLGSGPAAAGQPDLVTDLLGDSQAPPAAGQLGWRDALRVREAYARWLAFDTIDLRAGRMADHYGLGIQRNDGACDDCDFGSIIDRVALGFSVSGFRIDASWEFTATGATADLGFAADRQSGGQPTDLGQDDDVSTYAVRVGRFPTSAAELAARARLLDEAREWAVDWSLFSSFTDQTFTSSAPASEASFECVPSDELANGQLVQPYDCIRLFRRGAFFWRPGLWLKVERHPAFDERIRFELELAGIFGEVEHPQRLLEDDDEEGKTFQGLGVAGELEWRRGMLGLGLDLGFATGDDGEHVGVLDGQDVVDPDDDAFATNDALRQNRNITAFYFNRDYHLDLILFRQILGAVTNAVYFKPWVATDLLRTDDLTLSARLDVLYALALRPSGTPGEGRHWGIETDARATIELRSGFNASLAFGLLVPFDALSNRDTGERAELAGAARILLGWRF